MIHRRGTENTESNNQTSLILVSILCLALTSPVQAHVGPPFPILVDQPIPGYNVSVWADPDIGEALFYVVLEPSKTNSVPSVASLDLWVQPISGRLPRVSHHATQEPARGHLKFVAQPDFDLADEWNVGIDIRLAEGAAQSLSARVESTPPGLGPWDLLIYLFPFVLFGALWAMVFIRRTRARSVRMRRHEARTEFTGPTEDAS